MDVFYIPRTEGSFDVLYTEDDTPWYKDAISIEMYVKNVEGFQGDGDFLSKFGVEIRDRITFTVARRVFNDEVGSIANLSRPREGDIIYFPLNNKVFSIKFVEHEAIFYQMGSLQVYDLVCELFEYSNERFETGISTIDALDDDQTFDVTDQGVLLENGNILIDEYYEIPIALEENQVVSDILDTNEYFEKEGQEFINFSETNPFSEGNKY
jgi:Virus neck protein